MFSRFSLQSFKTGKLNSPVSLGVHALRKPMTTDKTWRKKCMADVGLVYSVIAWTPKNCLCPTQWEAADWGNLGHGSHSLGCRAGLAQQQKETPRAQPRAESTSLTQGVTAPRKGCHQLGFFPSHHRLAGPSRSYIIKPLFSCWLHDDCVSSRPVLHFLILPLHFLPFL